MTTIKSHAWQAALIAATGAVEATAAEYARVPTYRCELVSLDMRATTMEPSKNELHTTGVVATATLKIWLDADYEVFARVVTAQRDVPRVEIAGEAQVVDVRPLWYLAEIWSFVPMSPEDAAAAADAEVALGPTCYTLASAIDHGSD